MHAISYILHIENLLNKVTVKSTTTKKYKNNNNDNRQVFINNANQANTRTNEQHKN